MWAMFNLTSHPENPNENSIEIPFYLRPNGSHYEDK